MVGRRDAYWASGGSAITNSSLLSVLWAVGTVGADRNFQHWAEPRRSVGVGNLTYQGSVATEETEILREIIRKVPLNYWLHNIPIMMY